MERKDFIRLCGLSCLGMAAVPAFFQSCASGKSLSGEISGSDLLLPLKDFEEGESHDKQFKKYVIVRNEKLRYPLCVYRFAENDYSALLMKCTHQGAELQAFGSKLLCPAHGSEFDSRGIVRNGPADQSLRMFPCAVENDKLKISLK